MVCRPLLVTTSDLQRNALSAAESAETMTARFRVMPFTSVEVSGVEQLPLVLRGLEWAVDGAIAYQVRWTPDDLVDWQREVPSSDHRAARARAVDVVTALARAVHGAVGGEVVDQDEFLVEPDEI